ncbi:MAG: metallophosphoesterase, partial [Bacteroidales bacterium]|nr:metallophosphoesterase [Bacteroidales bacterium]
MKRGFTAGVQQLLLSFTILLTILTSCSKKDGEYYVDLYATNDLHGRFFDSLYVDNQAHPYSLAHISEWMRLVRLGAGKDNVMLIDLGDALQGDNAVYYANYIDTAKDGGKHLFTRIAEFMKYDALVVGNHDIEAGHPVYDRIKNETDIPYLAANAIDVATGKSYFKPYTILEKGGLKIAVIGMTNPNIKKWLGEELWSGMDFCPIEALADSLIQKVKATERPDITILAIHAGLGDGTAENIENPARYLAANLKGVDIIFASHDHQVACEKIWNGADSVLVMEGSNRAKFLSNVTAIVEYREGKLYRKKFTGRLIPVEKLGVDTSYANAFRNDFLNAKKFTN